MVVGVASSLIVEVSSLMMEEVMSFSSPLLPLGVLILLWLKESAFWPPLVMGPPEVRVRRVAGIFLGCFGFLSDARVFNTEDLSG